MLSNFVEKLQEILDHEGDMEVITDGTSIELSITKTFGEEELSRRLHIN